MISIYYLLAFLFFAVVFLIYAVNRWPEFFEDDNYPPHPPML